MNISICITTFNEADNISSLLESLLVQSKKVDEIVIVDGGSTDMTLSLINNFQLKIFNEFPKINFHLIKKQHCTRSRGRNIAVKASKNEIIAMIDAGCVAHKDWLKNITKPFEQNQKYVDISAGFYLMTGGNSLQKAMGMYLGVTPNKFNNNFLPSTRSIAFRKSAWKAVGGFPQSNNNSAEDTDFNYKAVKLGLKYARVKNALVEWAMPHSISEFRNKIYNYAKWDALYGIWWHPTQGFRSHNIKALSVLARYILGLIIFLIFGNLYILVFIGIYLIWAYKKAGLWGLVLQLTSDMAVINGFVSGIISKYVLFKRHT